MGKITVERSQLNPALESPVLSKNESYPSTVFVYNETEWNTDSGTKFLLDYTSEWTNKENLFSTPNKPAVMLDSTVDSGLGSAKSLSPRSPGIGLDDDTDIIEMRTNNFTDDPSTSELLTILDIKESNSSANEPPSKMPKKDDFNISLLSCVSSSSSHNSHSFLTNSLPICVDGTTTNKLQNSANTGVKDFTDQVSIKKHATSDNSGTNMNVSSFTDEATLGEHDIQNNCEAPDLAHLQSTLRALIREVSQTPAGKNTLKRPFDSAISNSQSESSTFIDESKLISKLASTLPSVKSGNSESFSKKDTAVKRSVLCANFPSRKKDGSLELRILSQPEEQHRARYLTEGSRGSIKDRRGTGFPTVKLFGYNKPVTLQVFIGTDQGRVQPHLFYQASQVCGKNSTSCIQKKIDGTTVLEIMMLPEKDMTISCDCVGILKERNVDVEQRLLKFGGTRNKKRSTRCRIVCRVSIPIKHGVETLQVSSAPIICTQPPGIPEICRASLSSCSVKGETDLFIIGKNFLKDTVVLFRETMKHSLDDSGQEIDIPWEVQVEPEKEYLQLTHLICRVPSYHKLDVVEAVTVKLFVQSGDKLSEPYLFTYIPLPSAENRQGNPISSKVAFGIPPGAIEMNQQIPQTVTSPTIIQLPLLTTFTTTTTTASQQSVPQDLLVIPATNSTVISTNSTLPLPSVMNGCTDILPEQIKPTQLQFIVVQPPTVPAIPENIKNTLKDSAQLQLSHSDIPKSPISISNSTSSNFVLLSPNMDNHGCSSEENKNDTTKLDHDLNLKVEHKASNCQCNKEIKENNLLLISDNDNKQQSNKNLVHSNIPEWNRTDVCNSLNECQIYFSNNTNSINSNVTNENESQTLRNLLLQGRQTISSCSQSCNVSTAIQSTLMSDQTDFSIMKNQAKVPEKNLSLKTSDSLTDSYPFYSDSVEKQNSEQLMFSFQSDNKNYECQKEGNKNFDQEFLSNSSMNNVENCQDKTLQASNNKELNQDHSFLKFSLPDVAENSFNVSENINQRTDNIEQQEKFTFDSSKDKIEHINKNIKMNQRATNLELQNSGQNVDHFSAITMLPEMELLSMINPSTFDNV